MSNSCDSCLQPLPLLHVAIFKCLGIKIVTVKFQIISICKLNNVACQAWGSAPLQHQCTESEKWKLSFSMQLYAHFLVYSQLGRFHNKVICWSFFRVFFEMKFGYSPSKADSINSIVYILSAVASPIAGFFIDKTGKAIFWIISGIVFTLVAHAMFAFTFIPAYYGMVRGWPFFIWGPGANKELFSSAPGKNGLGILVESFWWKIITASSNSI